MKNYLLDSSFLIDLVNEEKKAVELHEDVKGKALTSTICAYELSRYSDLIREKISEKEMVPFEKDDALEASDIYRGLEKRGKMIGETDIMIAAIARARGFILISRDEDFKKVDDLELQLYDI